MTFAMYIAMPKDRALGEAFLQSYEEAREPNGACTLERKPQFMTAFKARVKGWIKGAVRQTGAAPEELGLQVERLAQRWFEQNATKF